MRTNLLSRSAFTLVELLVTVAIVGILVTLLLPAIQSVRESARRIGCQNRLRQIAIGIHNYCSVENAFPPGTLGFDVAYDFDEHWENADSEYFWKRAQHTSALAIILPFLELDEVHKEVNQLVFDRRRFVDESLVASGFSSGDWIGGVEGFLALATTKIGEFQCPSDNLESVGAVFGGSQPNTQGGSDTDAFGAIFLDKMLPANYSHSNYVGCAGAHSGGVHPDPNRVPFTGILKSRSQTPIASVDDGLSSTFLFGENIGWIHESGERWGAQSWLMGGLARGRGSIPWGLETHPVFWHHRHLGDAFNSHGFGFGSKHPGGVNFVLGDGSTTLYSRDVDWQVLYQLCGANDGGIVDIDR